MGYLTKMWLVDVAKNAKANASGYVASVQEKASAIVATVQDEAQSLLRTAAEMQQDIFAAVCKAKCQNRLLDIYIMVLYVYVASRRRIKRI